jgi:hypothetical protein
MVCPFPGILGSTYLLVVRLGAVPIKIKIFSPKLKLEYGNCRYEGAE